MATKTPPHIKIEAKEYVAMKDLLADLKKRMDEADSDIAYTGYKRAWTALSNAYERATAEIHAVERADARKDAREKRASRLKTV